MAATSLNRVRGTTAVSFPRPNDPEEDPGVPPAVDMSPARFVPAPIDVHDLAKATETAAAAAVATLDRPSFATDTVVRWLDERGERIPSPSSRSSSSKCSWFANKNQSPNECCNCLSNIVDFRVARGSSALWR